MAAKVNVKDLSEFGIVILSPKGNFVGGDETDELKATIRKYSDADNKKLVINLGDVLYLTAQLSVY